MAGVYFLEQAILFGDSHFLFSGRKYATFHFLPCKFKELDPGVQSLLQAPGRQHKLRFCSDPSPGEAPLYSAMVECTLIKQLIQSLFVHKGMEITSPAWNVEEEAFAALTMVLVFGDKPQIPPWHIRNTPGARGEDIPEHVNLSAQKRSPLGCHGCCPAHCWKENQSYCSLPCHWEQAGWERGSRALCQEPARVHGRDLAAQRQETTYSSLIWNVKAEKY